MARPEAWLRQQRASITRRLVRALVRMFRGLDTYHVPDAERFGRAAAPLVFGAQHAMADAVAQSFAEQTRRESGRQTPPPSIPEFEVVDLRGVSTKEVYQRPFHEIWRELREQDEREEAKNLQKAIDLGEDRLEAIADLDLQLTYAHAAREAMEAMPGPTKPQWWRRVPQGSYTCALCLIASTKAYRTGELNPMHPACDCTVEPMFTPRPTGVIDEELLDAVHKRVKEELGIFEFSGRGQVDYRDLLIEITEEHGELGRILVHPRKRPRRIR